MEVTSEGIHLFRNINTEVPAYANKFTDRRVARNLKRAGLKPAQIKAIQAELAAESVIMTNVSADLITPPTYGNNLRSFTGQLDPVWSEYDLDYLQGTVTSAIRQAVGEDWNHISRKSFDALVMDGRRVAVITGGQSLIDQDQWFIREGQWSMNMADLIKTLESTSRYALIVANINSKGQSMRITQGIPFFYRANRRYEIYIP